MAEASGGTEDALRAQAAAHADALAAGRESLAGLPRDPIATPAGYYVPGPIGKTARPRFDIAPELIAAARRIAQTQRTAIGVVLYMTGKGGVVMRIVKIIFGVLCFGVGVALVMGAVNELMHPSYDATMDVAFLSMFGGMFLIGSFLLLRRSPSPPVSPGPVSPETVRVLDPKIYGTVQRDDTVQRHDAVWTKKLIIIYLLLLPIGLPLLMPPRSRMIAG